MRVEEARNMSPLELERVSRDPANLIAIIRVVILVLEFVKAYKQEIGSISRLILRATGWDKRLEDLEREAEDAIRKL